LEEFNRFEDEIANTIDFAAIEKDRASQQFLQSFLSTWIEYVATMNNIVDLAMQFAPNNESLGWQLFDDEFEKGITVGEI
jgi:ferritin